MEADPITTFVIAVRRRQSARIAVHTLCGRPPTRDELRQAVEMTEECAFDWDDDPIVHDRPLPTKHPCHANADFWCADAKRFDELSAAGREDELRQFEEEQARLAAERFAHAHCRPLFAGLVPAHRG